MSHETAQLDKMATQLDKIAIANGGGQCDRFVSVVYACVRGDVKLCVGES